MTTRERYRPVGAAGLHRRPHRKRECAPNATALASGLHAFARRRSLVPSAIKKRNQVLQVDRWSKNWQLQYMSDRTISQDRARCRGAWRRSVDTGGPDTLVDKRTRHDGKVKDQGWRSARKYYVLVSKATCLAAVSASLREGERLFAFLDDLHIVCRPERVGAVHALLERHLWDLAGISLHAGKTRVWNRSGHCPPACAALQARSRCRVSNCHRVERRPHTPHGSTGVEGARGGRRGARPRAHRLLDLQCFAHGVE